MHDTLKSHNIIYNIYIAGFVVVITGLISISFVPKLKPVVIIGIYIFELLVIFFTVATAYEEKRRINKENEKVPDQPKQIRSSPAITNALLLFVTLHAYSSAAVRAFRSFKIVAVASPHERETIDTI